MSDDDLEELCPATGRLHDWVSEGMLDPTDPMADWGSKWCLDCLKPKGEEPSAQECDLGEGQL